MDVVLKVASRYHNWDYFKDYSSLFWNTNDAMTDLSIIDSAQSYSVISSFSVNRLTIRFEVVFRSYYTKKWYWSDRRCVCVFSVTPKFDWHRTFTIIKLFKEVFYYLKLTRNVSFWKKKLLPFWRTSPFQLQ